MQRSIRKIDLLARLTKALAQSVYRNGDYFAFYGCTDKVLPDYVCSRTRDSTSGLEIAARLGGGPVRDKSKATPAAFSPAAIEEIVAQLPARRSMIFLVSDFYIAPSALKAVLAYLGKHRVIPVFIEDSVETRMPPAFGLTELQDTETGNMVSYFMRPALKKRYLEAFARHRSEIRQLCDKTGCPLLKIVDRFVADDISRYFMEH